jgi:hypothetical protein
MTANDLPDKSKFVTDGETLFLNYLETLKLEWEKDQPVGDPNKPKRPDYLVKSPTGNVLCEVKDIGEGKLEKASLKAGLLNIRPLLEEGDEYTEYVDKTLERLTNVTANAGGRWDPFPRLQEIFAEAGKQLRPQKGKLPCVVVLYNPGNMPHERDLFMEIGLAKNRFFTPNQNTTISAIAVLSEVYPQQHLLAEALEFKTEEVRNRFFGKDQGRAYAIELIGELRSLEDKLRSESPEGFYDESVPYLRIYHNKYAALALPAGFFSGKFDTEFQWNEVSKQPNYESSKGC